MRRWLLIVALWLLPLPAAAQINQCLDFSASWTTPYYQPPGPTIRSISYLINSQLMIGNYAGGQVLILNNVPLGVAQPFTAMTNADSRWKQIVPQYSKLLLNQNGCPLLAQSGHYLLASP